MRCSKPPRSTRFSSVTESKATSDKPIWAVSARTASRTSASPSGLSFGVAAFGPSCFYRSMRVGPEGHVDHVLPWSKVGLDGLANLVSACPSGNTSKSQLLPTRSHVFRALGRGRGPITELAASIDWQCSSIEWSRLREVCLPANPRAPQYGWSETRSRLCSLISLGYRGTG